MRNVKPQRKPKKRGRYHPVDLETLCDDEHENPDWLVGAN